MNKELNIDEMFLNENKNKNEKNEDETYEASFHSDGNPSETEIKEGICIGVEPSDDIDEKNSSASTDKKILEILPFLDENYLMELAVKIISNDSKYDKLQLKDLVCFMNPSNIDKIFFSLLTNKDERYKEIIPFISNGALSKITHLYIDRRCKFIDMNTIYPFLSNEDIKLVFEYALKNRV